MVEYQQAQRANHPEFVMQNEVCRPIFVLGLNKSGTSLLYLCLSRHPQLSAIQVPTSAPRRKHETSMLYLSDYNISEGHKLTSLPAKLRPSDHASCFAHPSYLPKYRLTEADVAADDWQLVHAAYHAAMVDSNKRLCEKSPPNLVRSRYLQALFPDATFVAIVRSPYANLSANAKKRNKWGTVAEQAAHWAGGYETLLTDSQHLRRLLIIHYEELVDNPRGTLAAVCAHCQLDYSPELLAGTSIECGVNDQLIALLTAADVRVITAACQDVMRRLGYDPLRSRGTNGDSRHAA